uniref:NADH:ubiquinone reductase (H(+)-translocating) n=1 Tax=Bombus pratorum TaxID=30194 RepID=A0A0S2LU19_BOMPR|nr:NADH dehydrogenase subunit 5 [Bombus pratorum]DBA43956.1 TPA_asm: ND5 [Bombus pratorum]
MMKMMVSGIILMIMSFIFMFLSFYILFLNKLYVYEWMIYNLNSMKMNFIFLISFKLLMFVFLVMLISSFILLYSISYMNLNNKYLLNRFYYLMFMFLMSMILLILSPNMLTLLLGWDGLGLISYCLIIYYQKFLSFNSGMITVILNRLGDSSLLMIISLMMIFGSWNLILYKMNILVLIMFFMMVFTKSAQLMFMIWLPAAMMAPTPVSSLVHSSTLVTAGIYLLINYEMMIDLKYKNMILMISSLTMLISGIMANFEMDFKKIIALSTLSQLGFMMSIYSLGMVDLTFLHLFIHAFFKSMMFMCVGSMIHYMNGIQNFRFYSGMFYLYPMKGLLMMFSLLMLCGFPFLVGFYSKDLIIEYYFLNVKSIFSLINLIFGTIFTVSYSFRVMFMMMNNSLMMNLIYFNEDWIMIIIMSLILMIMLILSKFIFNFFFFQLNMNLIYIYKYFVFKMMLLGFMFFMLMLNIYFLKKKMMFIKSFFMMEFFYKFIMNFFMNKMIYYDFVFEKGLIEKFSGKIMMYISDLMEMKMKYKIFYLLLMYLYFLILMLMI